MIKIFVDSGSSIKQEEQEACHVEILPLKILLGDQEYTDGVDLTMDTFYHALIEEKRFPQTSLPSIGDAEERVQKALADGNDVIILTISSRISGTFQTLKTLFADHPNVRVIDSKTAVGGIRFLVREAAQYLDRSLDFVEEKINALIPRIRIRAVPETLDYLLRGGRLSKSAWAFGSLLQVKPLIGLDSADGTVKVFGKERGLKRAMQAIADSLKTEHCDPDYGIIPSYTYSKENIDTLLGITDPAFRAHMLDYDHLDPAIACHWGPNAFGYIFVRKEP